MSIIPIFKYSGILWLLKFFSNIAGKSERKSIFKREDISTLAEIAEEQGVIKEKDSDFIKNIVKLQNVKLREIMTPSSVIKSADMNSTIEEFYTKNKKLPFSRIPIFSENKEEINYYVLKDTILEYVIQKNGKKKLSDIKRPIIKIGYESKITSLFDKLLKKREHISLVIDEFGAVRGIVTLEDIIETLLGLEIVDETDTVVDLQVLAKKRRKEYLKDVD
jgi:CBS domain containing-hemolysin-like protein